MRLMYDSLNPEAIPTDVAMVASYIDGDNAPAPGWESRFANAVIVKIARIPTTNDGHVLDAGDNGVTPDELLSWCRLRRAAGATPAAYTNLSLWPAMRAVFDAAGEPEPEWWIAYRNGTATLPAGVIANQFMGSAQTRADYDINAVADHWPGVDAEPAPAPQPLPSPAPAPAPAPAPGWVLYIVQEGDNESVIADRHGLTLAELEAANPHSGHPAGNYSDIWPGDHLLVPAVAPTPAPSPPPPPAPLPDYVLYIVQEGDNESVIADRHGMTLAELEAANPHSGHPAGNFSDIWPGDHLLVRRV